MNITFSNTFLHDTASGGCGTATRVEILWIPGKSHYENTFICSGCGESIVISLDVEHTYTPKRLYQVFGDESSFGEIVSYGLVVCTVQNLDLAEKVIEHTKLKYGVPSTARFHSREIFSGDARKKTSWRVLSELQVNNFVIELISELKKLNLVYLLGVANEQEHRLKYEAEGNFPAGTLDTKHLAGLAFQGAAQHILRELQLDIVDWWVDPDKTKIDWFGRKIQADKNYQISILGSDKSFTPKLYSPDTEPVLNQIADLFAYTSAHVLSDKSYRNQANFEDLYRLFAPKINALTSDVERKQPPTAYLRHQKILNEK